MPPLAFLAGFWSWNTTGVGICLYQDDIRANAADTVPGNPQIFLPANQSQNLARPWDKNGVNISLRDLHLDIFNKPQPPPVTDADHFFTLQLCQTNAHTSPLLISKAYASRGGEMLVNSTESLPCAKGGGTAKP